MNIKDVVVYPLIKVIRDLIGHRLSSVRGKEGEIPAVIHVRSDTPQLEFPYVSVDYHNVVNVGVSERDTYLNDNLDEVTEVDYIVKSIVRVHASNDQDALGIMEELRSRLMTTQGKRKLREYFSDATLLNTSKITFYPALQVTDYEESSRMSLDFWTRSIIVDDTTGVIESVKVDGELYDDYEQDYPPLDVKIEAP